MKTQAPTPGVSLAMTNLVMQNAALAAPLFRKTSARARASFLDAIAEGIEALGEQLIQCTREETHLSEQRLVTERLRTCNQLRAFSNLILEGSWVEASIDTALPERKPVPKPDLRKMLIPLGPVVVFGASNFPYAYSTAGGDTASALAAACPVIVKGHPAHPRTSLMVAEVILNAARQTGMPEHVFQHIAGDGFETGQALVSHPLTRAVGFTGSFAGGKALVDLANARPVPIPVFAEMGSVNPVCLLPGALAERGASIAAQLARSITNDMGQFCTKPGLQLAIENADLQNYIHLLSEEIRKVQPQSMLHPGIFSNFRKRREEVMSKPGVMQESVSEKEPGSGEGYPGLASVSAADYLRQPDLHAEVFGPHSILVRCRDMAELLEVSTQLEGQLTATIMGTDAELKSNVNLIEILSTKAGRIIINGVPTGVEVCPSMNHGGPFPATSDSRFSAVGTSAIRRFVRPVCFQNLPHDLLPDELRDENPLGIRRVKNGEWGK